MKIIQTLLIAVLIVVFSQSSYSQEEFKDLHVSIDLGKNVFNLATHREFRVRIENKTDKTIRFYSKNAKLGLSPIDKPRPALNSYFAFIKINSDKIKSGETIEIAAQLDKLHWYPTQVSYYAFSEEPNLEEIIRIFPGKYQVSAGAEIVSKDKYNNPTFYGANSKLIDITLK